MERREHALPMHNLAGAAGAVRLVARKDKEEEEEEEEEWVR